jgi:predicted DNA-binding transcriptional regulator AlpA
MTREITDPLLTEKELSTWIRVSLPNLQRMRSNGTGPHYIQLSPRRLGYRKSDVDAWLAIRTTDRIGALASTEGNKELAWRRPELDGWIEGQRSKSNAA